MSCSRCGGSRRPISAPAPSPSVISGRGGAAIIPPITRTPPVAPPPPGFGGNARATITGLRYVPNK